MLARKLSEVSFLTLHSLMRPANCLFTRLLFIVCASTLFRVDFLNQVVGVSPLIHHEEHVSNVDADAACQSFIEVDVARQAIPVSVECQSDEMAVSVEHRAAGVTSRDVVIGEEAELQLAAVLVGVAAVLRCRHSSCTTPRSLSISAESSFKPHDQSRRISKHESNADRRLEGTSLIL